MLLINLIKAFNRRIPIVNNASNKVKENAYKTRNPRTVLFHWKKQGQNHSTILLNSNEQLRGIYLISDDIAHLS